MSKTVLLLAASVAGAVATVPAKVKVAGWPDYVAQGAITDADPSDRADLDGRMVDAVFKYAGDGAGNPGKIVYPIFTQDACATATKLSQVNKRATRPVIVMYTAQMSNGVSYADWDNTNKVLMKHFANLMLVSQVLQTGINNQTKAASMVLNPDMMGMIQQANLVDKLMGADPFKIDVNNALQQSAWFVATAHEWHLSLYGKKLSIPGNHTAIDIMQMVSSGALQKQGVYSPWDIKTSFESECDRLAASWAGQKLAGFPAGLTDDFRGWVQASNWAIKAFAPDVTFGWQENVWNCGSDHWVHHDVTADTIQSTVTGPTLNVFAKAKLYSGRYKPDFLVFDKYERDPIPSLAGGGYIWNARDWDNYMVYVAQMSAGLDNVPVMLWQIPGGHLQTTKEPEMTEAATGGDYFLGNPDVAADLSNLQPYITKVTLDSTLYGCGSRCTLPEYMLTNGKDTKYDWSKGNMDKVSAANVFAILWGGGSTISVGAKPIDDHGWLAARVNAYQQS